VVVARVRSTLHEARLRFSAVSGQLELETDGDGAQITALHGEIAVDMRTLASGDRVLDWKIRGDLQPERWPAARFVVRHATGELGGALVILGRLAWHDHELDLQISGRTSRQGDRLDASCAFALDMNALGIKPPRLLLLKAEPMVALEVTLVARAG
jgi:hypothetical protein